VQIDGSYELRRTTRLLIKNDFQLCSRSISPEYRTNYRKKWARWLMQRKLTQARAISSECRSNGHRWNTAIFTASKAAPRPRDTLLTQSANSTSTSARHCDAQIPSLQETFSERLGKGNDVGIPFGNTWARWNKRSILHFNANEKVPRRKIPNPQGRLLAERNPKLDGVGKTKSSCG